MEIVVTLDTVVQEGADGNLGQNISARISTTDMSALASTPQGTLFLMGRFSEYITEIIVCASNCYTRAENAALVCVCAYAVHALARKWTMQIPS